ncbi:hypothetical protein H696_05616 [Fonticula alba]|uniref:Pseudouridine synthase RsuA/RluA-like domain-containing protein n=1 Tax=Fonticula alba TaxID=691883 RepID=A0A058Z2Z1_FONAL|nr:hypothetical protein H696_05616 [Fonticula alba]KCV67887.1 hypothetical protein H696_05616 [Fonticula alba]|eukprot:XP_009497707.1 hypothetical protein H696_05616 [Fonticula alba]
MDLRGSSCVFKIVSPTGELTNARADARVEPGDRVLVLASLLEDRPAAGGPGTEPAAPAPLSAADREAIRRRVLFCDSGLLAIDKPSGWASHGGSRVHRHIDQLAPALRTARSPDTPRLVHRLDKGTSGILLLGRTRASTARLSAMFRAEGSSSTKRLRAADALAAVADPGVAALSMGARRQAGAASVSGSRPFVEKEYWAIICGRPRMLSGVCVSPTVAAAAAAAAARHAGSHAP